MIRITFPLQSHYENIEDVRDPSVLNEHPGGLVVCSVIWGCLYLNHVGISIIALLEVNSKSIVIIDLVKAVSSCCSSVHVVLSMLGQHFKVAGRQ